MDELSEILNCDFTNPQDSKSITTTRDVPQQENKNKTDAETLDKLSVEMKKLSSIIDGNTQYLTSIREKNEHLSENFDSSVLLNVYTELLFESKGMMSMISYLISSSSIVDPDTITAASSLISSVRGVIYDMIQIYRDHLKHRGSIEIQKLKGAQKIKELEFKHKLNLELIQEINRNSGNGGNVIDGECIEYSQHKVFNNVEKL